jgi:hypothetical protein
MDSDTSPSSRVTLWLPRFSLYKSGRFSDPNLERRRRPRRYVGRTVSRIMQQQLGRAWVRSQISESFQVKRPTTHFLLPQREVLHFAPCVVSFKQKILDCWFCMSTGTAESPLQTLAGCSLADSMVFWFCKTQGSSCKFLVASQTVNNKHSWGHLITQLWCQISPRQDLAAEAE